MALFFMLAQRRAASVQIAKYGSNFERLIHAAAALQEHMRGAYSGQKAYVERVKKGLLDATAYSSTLTSRRSATGGLPGRGGVC
jgi:hypothetical protein